MTAREIARRAAYAAECVKPKIQKQARKCLKCSKLFMSEGMNNRICDRCKDGSDWSDSNSLSDLYQQAMPFGVLGREKPLKKSKKAKKRFVRRSPRGGGGGGRKKC